MLIIGCMLALLLMATPAVAQSGAGSTLSPEDLATSGRLFVEALRLETEGDGAAALREYQLLIQRFPASPKVPEALLRVARLRLQQGDPALALQSIEVLTQDYGSSPESASAYVMQGRLFAENPDSPSDLERARTLLRRVPVLFGRDRFPRLEDRAEALVREGQISLLLGELDEAASAFVQTLEDEPPGVWVPAARLGLARVLMARDQWVEAADALQRILLEAEAAAADDGFEVPISVLTEASRHQQLLYRLRLRPSLGQPRWGSTRLLSTPGLELRRPQGVAVSDDGLVIVTDRGEDIALVLDAEGQMVARRDVKDVQRPWWTSDEAYVAAEEQVRGLLQRSGQSFLMTRGSSQEELDELVSGARGLYGQWYLLDRGVSAVVVMRPTGRYLATLTVGEPVDLAQGPFGHILVLDGDQRSVTRYTAAGDAVGVVAKSSWPEATAVDVDALGQVYVLDAETATVEVFSSRGERIAKLGPTLPGGLQLNKPQDLAVDGFGRLYILDERLTTAEGRRRALVVLE